MYKTIIVPIDLANAEQSKPMIDVAAKLADDGAQVILVNVVEDVPATVAAQLPATVHQKIIDNAKGELQAMANTAVGKPEAVIRVGHPPTAIIELAEEKGADLVIVASHRPDWHDFLLGSTAARVVRHAKCSVLVVR